MAVVINDFEVSPGGEEAPAEAGQKQEQKGGASGDVEKQVAQWIHKDKERSLRNWAH